MARSFVVVVVMTTALVVIAACSGSHSYSTTRSPASAVNQRGLEPTVSPARYKQYRGDMNNDGQADVGDATQILRMVVGLDDDQTSADVNSNGMTDVGDGISVLRSCVGLDQWPKGWSNRPKVCVNWDACGPYMVYAQKFPNDTPEQIYSRIVADLASAGIDRIYYRISELGRVAYRSQETAWVQWDLQTGGQWPDLMQLIDPLEVIVPEAHKYGIPVYAWITLFESVVGEQSNGYDVANSDLFFVEHPEYMWEYIGDPNYPGPEWHWTGFPCYAYPEVREHRLNEIREIMAYGVDGFLFSLRESAWASNRYFRGRIWWDQYGTATVPVPRAFGFNPPVVEEYIQRYGIDPHNTDINSPERAQFVELTGEIFTRFMREVRAEVGDLPISMVSYFPWVQEPLKAVPNYIDGEALLSEGLIDEPWTYLGVSGNEQFDQLAGRDLWQCWWCRMYSYTGSTRQEKIDNLTHSLDKTFSTFEMDAVSFHELEQILNDDLLGVIEDYIENHK